MTTSASCSIEPDSRRSESCGRLSSRFSTCRDNCDSAMIGTLSSLASALRLVVISVTSCTRFSWERRVLDLLEIALVDAAAPDRARWDAALLGDDAGGELLGRHFEREEADDAAIDRQRVSVGLHFAHVTPRDIVCDVG